VPQSPLSQSALARARELVAENREADAAALLERSSTPEADELHLQIALRAATSALDARNIAAATAWLDRGLARNPADPKLNFFRGNLLLDSGHATAAAECFHRSLAGDPERLEFALALASALLAAGAPEKIPALLAAFPDSTQAQLLLAEACERIADLATARRACERASRLSPDQPLVWERLAQICEKAGDALSALVARTRADAIRTADTRPAIPPP
jgi:predicted Zn-dependent protease